MIRPPWPPTSYVVVDLGTLGGESLGNAINAAGIVTGTAFLSSTDPHGGGVRAFRYGDGVGMIAGLPHSNMSIGNGINNNLQIVGLSFLTGLEPHAFLAQEAFLTIDRGSLSVPSSSGDSIANDINDAGMVSGQSWTNESLCRCLTRQAHSAWLEVRRSLLSARYQGKGVKQWPMASCSFCSSITRAEMCCLRANVAALCLFSL